MQNKKRSDPVDVIADSMAVFTEYSYEDTDVSDEEFELAKRRFVKALKYLIIRTIEEFGNEKV